MEKFLTITKRKRPLDDNNNTRSNAQGSVSVIVYCLFVYSRLSNFSAIRRLSPLPVTGLQI
jgi:hypothetical protein